MDTKKTFKDMDKYKKNKSWKSVLSVDMQKPLEEKDIEEVSEEIDNTSPQLEKTLAGILGTSLSSRVTIVIVC